MGLASIEGFLLDRQRLSAEWGYQTYTETLLIKMDSPLEDAVDVQAALPAYDGGTTDEPTFTIGLSYHPGRPDLILKSAGSVQEHPEAGRPWWLIELTYQNGDWLNDRLPGEEQQRGRTGRNRKLNTAGDETIIQPWDEPPQWSGSSRSVRITTFHDSAGSRLTHANYLPLSEGIDVEFQLEQHQFTWNVEYSSFTYSSDVAPYVGKLNSASVFGASAKNVYLDSCTATENYRAFKIPVPDGETDINGEFHFITLTATFLIDRRGTTHGYWREANRRTDMHTLQFTTVAGVPILVPIPVNDRGDVAEEPWPLTAAGAGYPYSTINSANPDTDFAVIDPEFPLTAALHTFVSNNGLTIP